MYGENFIAIGIVLLMLLIVGGLIFSIAKTEQNSMTEFCNYRLSDLDHWNEIGDVRLVYCKNETGLYQYDFSVAISNAESEGMAMGYVIGISSGVAMR